MKIPGGKAGSVKRLKKEMEKSKGGQSWIRNVRAGEDMTVRFLTEPDEWYSYKEHYDAEVNYFPCVGEAAGCPGCDSDNERTKRSSRRFLANVLDVESGRVVPLKLPLDLANRLVARYERYGDTIRDRDYILHRMGQGLDTTYDVTPREPSDMNTSRYDLVDLEKALIDRFKETFDLDEDDNDQETVDSGRQRTLREAAGITTQVDDDDDEDTAPNQEWRTPAKDEVPSEPSPASEEDEDDGYLTEAEALKKSRKELAALAAQYGVSLPTNMKKADMVDAIFEAAGA